MSNPKRFQVVKIKGEVNEFTIVDTRTQKDYGFKIKGWENELVFAWCDELNQKYRSA